MTDKKYPIVYDPPQANTFGFENTNPADNDLAKLVRKPRKKKQVDNTEALISDLQQVAPIGPIAEVDDKVITNMGITAPSQAEPVQQVIDGEIPIRIHRNVSKLLDEKFGEASESVSRIGKTRVGEGKYTKNLIDRHNRKIKKIFRIHKPDINNVYICQVDHPDEIDKASGDYIVTIHTIGSGVNGIKIAMARDSDEIVAEEMMSLQGLIDKKYLNAKQIILNFSRKVVLEG